jgi:hypothetical protein
LDRLTRRDGEAYEPYIERIAQDALADLSDNLANNRRLADLPAALDVQEADHALRARHSAAAGRYGSGSERSATTVSDVTASSRSLLLRLLA